MKAIGDRIRQARKAKNMAQPALAAAAGVSKGTISQWETGMTKPKGANLHGVAKVLGVSPEYLLTGAKVVDGDGSTLDPAIAEMSQMLQGASEEDRERAVRIVRSYLTSGRDK